MSEENKLTKPEDNSNFKKIIPPPQVTEPIKKLIILSINFDGVIHECSKDLPENSLNKISIPGAIEFIGEAMWKHQFSVFVTSNRNPNQIKEWFDNIVYKEKKSLFGSHLFGTKIIPNNIDKWDEKCILGITNRKLYSTVHLEDRAMTFDGDFDSLISKLYAFENWLNNK